MVRTRTRRIGLAAVAVIAGATAGAVPASIGRAAGTPPSLRMVTGIRHIEIDRFGSSWDLFIPESVYVAATNGAFEIDAKRHKGGPLLEQVARNGSSVTKIRQITAPTKVRFDEGLPDFFSVVLTNASGKVVASAHSSFCPSASYDAQRISPASIDNPTYPETCGDGLTKAIPWGIDAGWAVPQFLQLQASPQAVPDGKYTLTVTIAPTYADQLKVAPADRSASLITKVVTQSSGCQTICPPGAQTTRTARDARAASAEARARRQAVAASHQSTPNVVMPSQTRVSSGGLPDLIALPAHGLGISHNRKSGKDFLGFGATIWNAGPGTFDVEGFRNGGRPTMRARQYIYRGGHSVQSMNIGHFEFDNRVGHHHWHLEDVARYDLLDASHHRVVLSDKQSFCLAPTDPINLTVPGALWNPDEVGLESACPTDQSLWLRETLPVGWGDTYVQEKGGQSFNITGLPNGHYIIRIETNPFGNIHETTRKNDTSLLSIELGGVPGARTVTNLGPIS